MKMRHPVSVAVCLVGALLFAGHASAQFVQQGPKLVGTGAAGSPEQGYAVALSADGNTAVVGGATDSSNTGATWIWTRSSGVWSQQAKLAGAGAVGPAHQGTAVAISADGNTVIIGGPMDNSSAGAAWIWTRSGSVWTQQGNKLVGLNGGPLTNQGASVALSADGNTALVGGPGGDSVGAVWVWVRSGGVWSQQGNKLVGTGTQGVGLQGSSIALSADGNTALVGSQLDNQSVGAVWV